MMMIGRSGLMELRRSKVSQPFFDRHVQVKQHDIDADATVNCDRLVAIERMQHIESFAA